jgi:hypothetical protein
VATSLKISNGLDLETFSGSQIGFNVPVYMPNLTSYNQFSGKKNCCFLNQNEPFEGE